MIVLRFECAEDEQEELTAELSARETSGIVEQELGGGRVALTAFFADPVELGALAQWLVETGEAEERDWVAETQDSYPPLLIGTRFFLAPEWTAADTPEDRLRLPTHPGMACGTGYHEATQLCLEAMELVVRAGQTFLDVGVGSGLLTTAASLLGATRRIGCDIDAEAVEIAKENLHKDRVGAGLFAGSVTAVRSGVADVLVANISAAAHVELAAQYRRVLNGVALLSGFEEYEEDAVVAAVSGAGLRVTGRRERHHWVCLTVQ